MGCRRIAGLPSQSTSFRFERSLDPDADAPDLRRHYLRRNSTSCGGYNNLMLDYKSDFLDVLDLTAPIDRPPGELMVDVRVIRMRAK